MLCVSPLRTSCLQLVEMRPVEVEGKQQLTFTAPSRGLIGFRLALVPHGHLLVSAQL